MKITDITCADCGASYQVAESATAKGASNEASCAICGNKLAKWDDEKLKAFRMIIPPHHKYGRPHYRQSDGTALFEKPAILRY